MKREKKQEKERKRMKRKKTLQGKLFLQFIGLIYLSQGKHAMDKAGLFRN